MLWALTDAVAGQCDILRIPDDVSRYPSIGSPDSVNLFFPSFYQHFSASAPYGFGNDGILDIRLVTARDTDSNLTYVPAVNGRAPFVPLGINKCGEATVTSLTLTYFLNILTMHRYMAFLTHMNVLCCRTCCITPIGSRRVRRSLFGEKKLYHYLT